MVRRSAARRVEEFILFDVLYEDGTRTSNRKVPGSELSGPAVHWRDRLSAGGKRIRTLGPAAK